MTFWQQIVATFIGSLFGFSLGILLFIIREQIKARRHKSQLIKCLKKECEFNLIQIDGWLEVTDLVLRRIASSDRELFYFYRIHDFQRTFTLQCFEEGILYDNLTYKDLTILNEVLVYFSLPMSEYLNSRINLWKDGQLEKAEGNREFELVRDQLKGYREFVGEMLTKIK